MEIILCILLLATETCFSEKSPQGIYGIYSGFVGNYSLTFPVLVDDNGDELFDDAGKRRKKRNTEWTDLNYKLKIEEEEIILQLSLNTNFISPYFVVERRSNGSRTRKTLYDKTQGRNKRSYDRAIIDSRCHYTGKVKGHDGSKVALSACQDGLAGVIITERYGEYWLEPTIGSRATENSREHIMFKRTNVAPGSKKKKRKRKKKHEKNCGTREPRRFRKMRFDWRQQVKKSKILGRGRSRKSRWRRSVSKERYVEALIVADTSMMKFHQYNQIETYLLTIMNMVSALYQDPSIGNQINVVVVNMILIEDEDSLDGLSVTVNADKTLESFCKWQDLQNYEESHPNHHDVAILITREDICARKNIPCGTLGVAHVGGMCEKERSCNVNEDNGITLAHTITHELGHNFGMYHDSDKIGCPPREGSVQHVMTPSFEADTVHVSWSSCSRRDITNFLDKGYGSCLDDKSIPDEQFQYPNLLAGAAYDASYQCQLQFGSSAMEVCTSLHEICFRLWCIVDGVCTTMLKPAAPGTTCGEHSWCINQECVPMAEQPEPVNGGWSDWSGWSECSRSCGAGVAIMERKCDNPVPAFGGKFCIGERKRYKICNTQDCPENTPSFRAVQCSKYDNQIFQGRLHKWVPYFDKADPCELYCSDEKDNIVVPRRTNALDGTPCRIGSRDMCIQGICKKVGCDWVVDSDAKEDKCGICNGDEQACDSISGTYNKTTGSGYVEVVTIPSGARNIHIVEMGNSKNYIGIGSAESENFYLNGKLEITPAGEYTVASSVGLYEREKEAERIHIPGPIKEDIIVYIIYRGKYKNFGISYNYTVSKKVEIEDTQYEWNFSEWSSCSVTCGSGFQISKPFCKEKNSGLVDDGKCDRSRKPDKKMRVCSTQHCPTRWWTAPWQLCPSTCGDPNKVLRRRTVLCIEQKEEEPVVYSQPQAIPPRKGIEYVSNSMVESAADLEYLEEDILALPDSECKGQEKPQEEEPCPHLLPCNATMVLSSEGVTAVEDGFSDYRNVTTDRIMNFDRKEEKIRHGRKHGNDSFFILDNAKEKKVNKRNKKFKRRRKYKPKKIKTDEADEVYTLDGDDILSFRRIIRKNTKDSY